MEFGHRAAVLDATLVEGDVGDQALVRHVVKEHQIDGVIHFAAYKAPGESMRDPGRYFANNVCATAALLETLAELGVDRFVFSSTCAVYGEPRAVPLVEGHPRDPVSPYGESKLAVEKVLKWYARAYPIRYAALRYFNAAGADPGGEIGEDHDPETHLIPLAIDAALGGRGLDIFGTDYPTPDGTAIRDYIHVDDLADAHLAALERLAGGTTEIAVNLGTGRGHSVRSVIAAVEKVSGRKVAAREVGRRAGDPPELVADARKAAELLGWKPRYTDLDAIVEHAFRWRTRQERR